MKFQAVKFKLLLLLLFLLLLVLTLSLQVYSEELTVKIRVYDYSGESVSRIGYVVVYTSVESGKSYIYAQGESDENGLITFSITEDMTEGIIGVSFYKGTYKVGSINLEYPKLEYEVYLDLYDLEVEVLEDDGDLVDHALVSVFWEEIYGEAEASNYTGSSGEPAIVEDVPPTSVRVEVSKLGFTLETLEVNVDKYNYKFRVVVGGLYDLKVKVVDAGEAPISEVPVYLSLKSGSPMFTEYTNDNGEVEFTGLPRGTYYVGAVYKSVFCEAIVELKNDKEVELRFNFYIKPSEISETTSSLTFKTRITREYTATVTSKPLTKPTKTTITPTTLKVVVTQPSTRVGRETVTIEFYSVPEKELVGRVVTELQTYTTTIPPGEYIVRVYSGEELWSYEKTVTVEGGGGSIILQFSSPTLSFQEIMLRLLFLIALIVASTFSILYILKFRKGRESEVS